MNFENNNINEPSLPMDRPLSLRSDSVSPVRNGKIATPKAMTAEQRRRTFLAAAKDDLVRRFPIFVLLLLCCFASYFLASRYMVCTVVIRGRSMTPTLRDGDQFLLNRVAYLFRGPRRGDLVVIHDPGHSDLAIKRIVGLPGDVLEIKNGKVFVNHKALSENYLAAGTVTRPAKGNTQVLQLGQDKIFVMGDNRGESEDSRYYGAISTDAIVGVVSLE